jgi:hypothetical protein
MPLSTVKPSQPVRKVSEKPEDIEEQLLRTCLKYVPFEERIREASKPLYLKRYE